MSTGLKDMKNNSGMTSVERTESALAAIAAHNQRTNAFILVDAEGAMAQARAADDERRRGVDRGPLHGVPISIKDLVDIAGQPTTAGSRVLEHNVAAADAPIITRLRAAGAVIVGKTNMHEFALGTTCEDSGFGAVHHPLDPSRSAGGSSGGSAVSVATGMSEMSVGTDTGGSIRIPSSICGLVGLKPSAHSFPKEGVIPLSTTLDHVGPITKSVEDAGAMWRILADRPNDIVAIPKPGEFQLGLLTGYFTEPLESTVRAAFDSAIARLRDANIPISDCEILDTADIHPAYVNVVLPEAAAWHARYLDTQGSLYRDNVRARLLAGRDVSAVNYFNAIHACEAYRLQIDNLLIDLDALVLPTLPITAPVLGQDEVALDGRRVNVRAAMLRNTQLFNMTGHPAISLPLRMTPGLLPCGLQLVGRLDKTAELLAIAAACEKIVS
jgi:aspartyl-tRNA(Asn)/glutamyl-tRNA(Gln) amidotransferase subunit A